MNDLKQLKWSDYIWLYSIPTLLNYVACQLAIPYLEAYTSLPIEIIYFISVGGIALVPMFFGALYLVKNEINSGKWSDLLRRMKVKKLSKKDWLWTIFAVLIMTQMLKKKERDFKSI